MRPSGWGHQPPGEGQRARCRHQGRAEGSREPTYEVLVRWLGSVRRGCPSPHCLCEPSPLVEPGHGWGCILRARWVLQEEVGQGRAGQDNRRAGIPKPDISGRGDASLPACGVCHRRTAARGPGASVPTTVGATGASLPTLIHVSCGSQHTWALRKAGQREQCLAFSEPLLVG